ncbi:Kelch-like protein 13 [Folsomia candida]|uniref:Kelch-like protein 13 n=1 Tax=Folsomia candida TaxID=158441 RepID=A0A226DIA7_FOLCA|nr:Kelch-like protein 13 [Folsomia candida]
MEKSIIIFLTGICIASTLAVPLHLVATPAKARLPLGAYGTSAVFDGTDSIYIIGGDSTEGRLKSVLKYSISTDEISHAAILPHGAYYGTATQTKGGDIFYHGASILDTPSTEIYKFVPSTSSVTKVGDLPEENFMSAAVQDGDDNIYFLGGSLAKNAIVSFNTVNSSVDQVYRLPISYDYIAALSDNFGSVFIFGDRLDGSETTEFSSTVKLNFTTFEVIIGSETLPKFTAPPAAVWDAEGKKAYIIGGYGNEKDGHYSDTIVRFDPETMTHELVHVDGFPVMGEWTFDSTSAVFVGGLNRIYFFGGYSSDGEGQEGKVHDNIWYIDV